MHRETAVGIVVLALMITMIHMLFRADGICMCSVVYIRADGSVEPPTSPISVQGNDTYTLNGNIAGSIVVERDNISIEGAGYTIQGKGIASWGGIILQSRNNVTIKNVRIDAFDVGIIVDTSARIIIKDTSIVGNEYGLWVLNSANNTISGNYVGNDDFGIKLDRSSNNTISENDIVGCYDGIMLQRCSGNEISANNVTSNNDCGFAFYHSVDNHIYRNNIENNSQQVYAENSTNVWDDGYAFGGNRWSDYTGSDRNHDGIGDQPYMVDDNNTDSFPLMGESHNYQVVNAGSYFTVDLVSNSTILNLDLAIWIEHPENKLIMLTTIGETGFGFCRLGIPKDLLEPPYTVTIDNGQTPVMNYNQTLYDNGTHRWIYFAYLHSEHEIAIVPEFPISILGSSFLLTILLILPIHRKKRHN